MKKVLASIAATGVLVVGAFAASTITSTEASAQTDDIEVTTDAVRAPHPGVILDEVLDELVEDGTLEQDQADSVKSALAVKRDELKEKYGDRMDRREHRAEMQEQIQTWLKDGVITADELSELPFDLPRAEDGPLAEALEDGEITQAEWDAFIEQRKANHEARRGTGSDPISG